MLWRHLSLARSRSAAGLLTCVTMLTLAAPALAEPAEPAPTAATVTATVKVLEARDAGDLTLDVRGQGQDRVRVAIRNTSARRLLVVLPPGLVAASATGQAGGGRGGFQSMGLGSVSNAAGAFGQFRTTTADGGFHSVPAADDSGESTVTVPAGRSVELTIPAVCLNFGMPTPTPRDKFTLVDVNDYTRDDRARKALRSLATFGTSHGVAQAVAWHVFNGMPFDALAAQAGKIANIHEVTLAARFVEALDASSTADLVDPAYLLESRLFVEVEGEGATAADAVRLSGELDGLHLLGLPVRSVGAGELPVVPSPALHLKVTLTGTSTGETRGRVAVSHATPSEGWTPLGRTAFAEGSTLSVLDGPGLARALDRAVASAFVVAKPAKRGARSTTLKVENRLPFTLATVRIRPTGSSGSVSVPFHGVGIGPARSGLVPIEAQGGVVDRIELSGL